MTLQHILSVLKEHDINITDKQLAELISHEVLAGTSYFKQLNKQKRVIQTELEEDLRHYKALYLLAKYKYLKQYYESKTDENTLHQEHQID